MTPKERGRFCGACEKKVHDLSAMSESDAADLLASGGDICISYLSDKTGTVQFQPSRIVPVRRLLRRASAGAAAGLSLALAACAPHAEGRLSEATEAEQTVFLQVRPVIPDAEPCDAALPGETEQELVRSLGAPVLVQKGQPAPESASHEKPSADAKATRTSGMPAR